MKLHGVTHDGHRYHVVTSPDDAPPVVLDVEPETGGYWGDSAPTAMVGQSFGMKWKGRVILLRVVAAQVNNMNGCLRLTCR